MDNKISEEKVDHAPKPAGLMEEKPMTTEADKGLAGMIKESLVGQVDLSQKSQSDLDIAKSPLAKWRESLFFKPKKKAESSDQKEPSQSIFKQAGEWANQEKLQEALLKAHKEVNPSEKFFGDHQEKKKVFAKYFPENSQKFFKESDIKKKTKELEKRLIYSAKPGEKEQLRKQISALKKIA